MADENIVDEVVDTKAVAAPADNGGVQGTSPSMPASGADATPTAATASADDKPVAAPADWPTDWREKAAGGDSKKLQRLSRYTSPQALADALIAAQNKISSGEVKAALGKDPKPEELAAYREAHGIPETPDKYDLGDLQVPAEEKDMVSKFLVAAHEEHMTPAQVRKSLEAYTQISEDAKAARFAKDNEIKVQAEDKLRAEWGPEYRQNINLITNFLDAGPPGLRESLLLGRLADGTPVGSSPEALQWLANLAREKNPTGIVAPSGDGASGVNALSEYQKLQKELNTRAYQKDEQKQAYFRQLASALLRQGLIDENGNVKRVA